jgi:hypothetical protein
MIEFADVKKKEKTPIKYVNADYVFDFGEFKVKTLEYVTCEHYKYIRELINKEILTLKQSEYQKFSILLKKESKRQMEIYDQMTDSEFCNQFKDDFENDSMQFVAPNHS